MCSAPPATFPRADGKVKRISLPEDIYIKKFFQKHPDSKHEDAIKYCLASICLIFLCSLSIVLVHSYDMLITYQFCYKFGFLAVLACGLELLVISTQHFAYCSIDGYGIILFYKLQVTHYLICSFDPPPARLFGLRVLDLKEQGVSEEEAMAVADMEYRAEKKAKKKAYSRLKQIARLQGKKPPPNPYPSAIKEIQAEERKYVCDRFFNPKILEIVQKLKEEKAAEAQDRFRGGGW
nr:hypothetical protein CFP56_41143 [Quercus suber]